jgi:molybdate transport system substrate-binding protein
MILQSSALLLLRCLPWRTFIVIGAVMLGMKGAIAAQPITIFAAASLKNALDDVARRYEARTQQRVVISYAGSSVLARQIQQGAPADVFLSANQMWMNVLEEDGLLKAQTRRNLLGNRLVLIGHGAQGTQRPLPSSAALLEMLGEGRLAMALVNAVPAGMYGKAALQSLGMWEDVAARVAQTDNVRAALALVAAGEAPLGIVYATDAIADSNVHVVSQFPSDAHPPIVYPVAEISESRHPAASAFLAFLSSPPARAAFEQHGFAVVGD